MLEAMSSAILLVAGGWAWLIAFGKVRLSRDPDRVAAFRRKYGVALSVVGIILMTIGLIRMTMFILSGADSP